jgi:hypothetical protein
MTINVQSITITVQILYHKYKSQIDQHYLEWVGEEITSILRYLWQYEYGRGP